MNVNVSPVWKRLCALLDDIPRLGSRVVKTIVGNVAVFRTGDDEVFALRDECPHKQGPLSQGIVHGKTVTCPLHGWKLDICTGRHWRPTSAAHARSGSRSKTGWSGSRWAERCRTCIHVGRVLTRHANAQCRAEARPTQPG
jgi:nitrite reductase (NADH) small subunit